MKRIQEIDFFEKSMMIRRRTPSRIVKRRANQHIVQASGRYNSGKRLKISAREQEKQWKEEQTSMLTRHRADITVEKGQKYPPASRKSSGKKSKPAC